MTRIRTLTLSVIATLALAGAVTPVANAGAHWSNTKCVKSYLKWSKQHFHGSMTLTAKQNKEADKHVKQLERQHHCVIGG